MILHQVVSINLHAPFLFTFPFYFSLLLFLQEMTVLAFVFDHLLLGNLSQNSGTPPISKVARSFLQCLATIQYPQDAILILVNEFKLAFQRALGLAESQMKHIRIRTLASLLSQILDAPNNSRMTVNPTNFSRLLIRRGFISDLARATHCLSLNSSHLVGTVNNILKPLEVLTRIVNQVASSQHRTGMVSSGAIPLINRPTTTSATQTNSNGSNLRSVLVGTATHPATPPTATTTQTPPTGSQATPQQQENQPSNPELSTPSDVTTPQTSAQASTSTPAPTGGAQQVTDTSFLEATHESLIPLEEEEDDEREREQRHEIITLAQELGRQHREELTAAASGDMDIQVNGTQQLRL